MEKYSSLTKVSNIFKILGWIQLVVGSIVTLGALIKLFTDTESYMVLTQIGVLLLAALVTFIGVIFSFGLAELIKLFINMALHVESIDNKLAERVQE